MVRQGQSLANQFGLFTELLDSPLTKQCRLEAEAARRRLAKRSWRFSDAFTSTLTRAVVSGWLILDALGQPGLGRGLIKLAARPQGCELDAG